MTNKRIQELAEQAGLKVESWMTNPPKPFQILGGSEEFERFAKLIVEECCKEITQEPFNAGAASVWLKEHFGIT